MRTHPLRTSWTLALAAAVLVPFLIASQPASAQTKKGKKDEPVLTFPPTLPGGKEIVTVSSPEFLKAPATIRKDVTVAKTPPTVDFLYYPGQTYQGRIWSNWGEGQAIGGKYYSAIGDHDYPRGHAFVYEYDPASKDLRMLVDIAKLLADVPGYLPGKVHGRLDMGSDGWLYFATHTGSARGNTDEHGYQGDWIIRHDPRSGKSEILAHGPVPKHSIPASILDPDRLIFYGGTDPGRDSDDQRIQFFAYDVRNRKLLYSGPDGPYRFLIFARSTGNVYYVAGGKEAAVGPLTRFHPDQGGPPVPIRAKLGLRATTQETPRGFVYTVSYNRRDGKSSTLYSFNTKTEKAQELGPAAVGAAPYVASLAADPTGRYVYYVPGAHGGSDEDGSPIVQFDTTTRKKKVIAFLHPHFQNHYGATLAGTYSCAVDPQGDKLYITWNVNRGSRAWDCCALTVVHIPESER